MKLRRLADLYVTGVPLTVKDPQGNEVDVWLQKPNPVDHESCIRRANAARARLLLRRDDEESEDWQSAYSEAADFGDREAMITYVISPRLAEKQQSIQAELALEDEWAKDGYLQGIYDAWEGDSEAEGFKAAYARDPEDPEALRVLNEMRRFDQAIADQLEPEIVTLRRDYEGMSDAELLRRVTNRVLETKADRAWLRELNYSELFYAVREPDDHTTRHFQKRAELDVAAPEVIGQLLTAYRTLVVDPAEGKDSAATDDSSPSSAPPATEATEPSSGPLAVVP